MKPTTPEAIDRLLFKGTFVTCCKCMIRENSKHNAGSLGDAAFAQELYTAGWRVADETNTICPVCVKWRNANGFTTLAMMFLLLALTGCASAPRSELTVQVEQREERPVYSVSMKVVLP